MSRRALIIGLGRHTYPLLEATRQVFAANGCAEAAQLLWLPPTDENRGAQGIDTYPLTLSRDKLNEVYYQPQVRAMSSMNWKSWGGRLASNRLWGKVAFYTHTFAVQQKILEYNDALATDGAEVTYYLLAHLHDPFASGAFLDCAYLLNDTAVRRKGHVFGLLLLPGIPDDPVVETDTADGDVLLRQATCYAALRELNFALGEHTFFDLHHSSVSLSSTGTMLKDEAPFQTGDCYLIGGSQDEKLQTIQYQQEVPPNIARWIYMQTCTLMRNRIAASQRGFISAFDVYVPELRRTTDAETDATDATIAALLRRMTRTDSPVQDVSAVNPWLNLLLDDIARRDYLEAFNDVGLVADEDQRDEFMILETQYDRAVTEVHRLEEAFSRRIRQRLTDALPGLDAILKQLRAGDGVTLFAVQEAYHAILINVDERYDDELNRLLELERTAQTQRAALLQQRDRYLYAAAPFRSWLTALYILTLVSLAFFLALVQAGLLGIVIAVAGFIGIRSFQIAFRGNRLRDARQAFVRAQRSLLQTQVELVEQRAAAAYLGEVRSFLNRALSDTAGGARAERMVSYLNELASRFSLKRRTVGGDGENATSVEQSLKIEDDTWREFAPRLTEHLWTYLRDKPLTLNRAEFGADDASIRNEVRSFADNAGVLHPEQSEIEALGKRLAEMNSRMAPMLMYKRSNIQEGERDHELRVVAAPVWDARRITALAPYFQEYQLEPVSLYEMRSQWEPLRETRNLNNGRHLESPLVEEISLHVHYNIPISALQDIATWRRAYLHQIQSVIDQNTFTFRGFLHPTRVGCAVPDVLQNTVYDERAEELKLLPEIALVIALFVRHTHQETLIKSLCDDLRLFRRPGELPSIDELSGALSENQELVLHLLSESDASLEPDEVSAALSVFLSRIYRQPPKFSERYADWEIWLIEHLTGLIESDRPVDRPLRALLARLYRYLALDESSSP